jgi:hypothetical protein
MALRALILAAAVAQGEAVWGTAGAWERVAPATSLVPPLLYRGAAALPGAFVAAGNNSATGALCAYSFDFVAAAWTQLPDVPAAIGDPFTFTTGGRVTIIDELNVRSAVSIDATRAAGGAWSPLLISGGPTTPRVGERFVEWGATLYFFGGVEFATGGGKTPAAHNDVWALDLIGAAPGALGAAWVQVTADGVAGVPPGRVGYSFTPFGVGAVLFGGVSVVDPTTGLDPMSCYNPANAAACFYDNAVWAFLPGAPSAGPAAGSFTGANWLRLGGGAATGAPPAGRFSHISAAMGDQLFVFGGTGAAGTLADLWAYNLQSEQWSAVAPSSPAPSAAGTDIGYGVGHVVGYHLMVFSQAVDAGGNPTPGSGQLWRWSPAVATAGGAAPAAAAAAPLLTGVNAALAINILATLATGAGVALLVRASRAAPAPGFYGGGAGAGAYAPPLN